MENNYLLSEEFSNKYNIVPGKIKDGRFYAYCLSVDKNISDEVEKIVKMPVEFTQVGKSEIERLRKLYYKSRDSFKGMSAKDILDELIRKAYFTKASDIHFDPQEGYVSVRFRIIGSLINYINLDADTYMRVVSRIKILSNLDIAQKRLPQDGGFDMDVEGRKLDIRVAIIPTVHGEKTVLRLLNSVNITYSYEGIGLEGEDREVVNNLISQPSGLILICGPTGSGKSSTSYTLLNLLNKSYRNILTIEDPVEYKLKGINQVQVNDKVGMDFNTGLHSLLRLDPDILMVGEIRDEMGARVALRASITGHLVLSTLHANDSVAAIIRLLNMNQEAYMVAGGLMGIISQRLYRKLCPYCKEEYHGYSKLLQKVTTTYRAKGCDKCVEGYKDRGAVFEILSINDSIRGKIKEDIKEEELRKIIEEEHIKTLKDKFVKLVEDGVTSEEEVFRNIFTMGMI